MSNTPEPKKILATAKFKDFAAYRAWWLSEDKDYDWMANFMDTHKKVPGAQAYIPCMDLFYRQNKILFRYVSEEAKAEARAKDRSDRAAQAKKQIREHLDKIEDLLNYAETFNQRLNIHTLSEEGAYIFLGNPDKGFYIADPYTYLDIELVPDYSALTILELRSMPGASAGNVSSTLPANVDDSLSVGQAMSHVEEMKDRAKALEKELDDARNYRCGELATLKAELDRMEQELQEKKRAIMAELDKKKEELQAQIDQMNRQVYLLESEIYAIRCYMGDTVSFAKVRSGKNAPDTEPVVLHQKLRFLEEDLGRLISLYELEWNERDKFEHFLAHSPHALDTFAPNERCVTLVRLTRNNQRFEPHAKIKYALDWYEAYHGTSVGIIIRNGENLYMGWTDDEKVHIKDDFLLNLKPRVVEEDKPKTTPESEYERKQRLEREQAEAARFLDGIISRVFIFNILQGIVDSSNILPLPKGEKISKRSEYVQFSLSDMWLTDNRFGSFTDIVARCNAKISTGDKILTTQQLNTLPKGYYSPWRDRTCNNERGIGDRNRTHDCEVGDCTIYPINKVVVEAPTPMIRYRYKELIFEEYHEAITEARNEENLSEDTEILERYEKSNIFYYISVPKYYSDAGATSNFQVYPSEFINLTYMNSVWLSYAITTKNLGGWTIGHQNVDYGYAIRYLNTAMDFIRKREAGEKQRLDALAPGYTDQNPDWPLTVTEWKLSAGVRDLTEYQAKRFLKAQHVL